MLGALLCHPDTGYALSLWDFKAELFGVRDRKSRSGTRIILSEKADNSASSNLNKVLRRLDELGLVEEHVNTRRVRRRDRSLRAFRLTIQALREYGLARMPRPKRASDVAEQSGRAGSAVPRKLP